MKTRPTFSAALLKHFYWIWLALLGAFVGGGLLKFVLGQL